MSSLPVPFSPRISTLASVGPARSTTSITFLASADSPIIWLSAAAVCLSKTLLVCRKVCVSFRLRRSSTAVDTVATTFSFCQGLAMKSVAPRFMASTAVFKLPWAVIITTTICGSICRIFSSQICPSLPLDSPGPKFMSSSTTSKS